jgi:hypothetical protein
MPMEVFCGHCRGIVGYSGTRPKFCSHCGQPLTGDLTAVYDAAEGTDVSAHTAPGTRRQVDGDEPPPTAVGGYKLLRPLGGGAMGTVYEAEDSSSGRRVAVKLIVPELTDSASALERFRQEGKLASSIVHPRAVFVLAADEDAGRPYIVMELMPGSTLADLVAEQGPLPPEAAITRILDVIEGLEAAHERGLIHRDVKPSNCFVEAGGRVKVGDFGLAKSAARDAHLTRTGTFLGTPLFAAPEQIKCEVVDAQSDVYSVAATLYFLLSGRAPFQTGDTMATLARIVSEPPPPLRSLRPEIPRALDKVVLRGLERDRRRRWRSLDDFRKALVPFLPAEPSIAGMGLRLVAYSLDYLAIVCMATLLYFAALVHCADRPLWILLQEASDLLAGVLYFGVLEGIWGWSLGKRLLRLRVGTATGNQPPGLGRAGRRCAIMFLLLNLGTYSSTAFLLANGVFLSPEQSGGRGLRITTDQGQRPAPPPSISPGIQAAAGSLSLWGSILGIVALMAPMRPMNGFRGLHELWSGTRTYRLRWPRRSARTPLESWRFPDRVAPAETTVERLGPFRVLGAVRHDADDRLVLAEDPQLGRRVHIWLRPHTAPALPEQARNVNRSTRARWVAGGMEDSGRWDAFLAGDGATLPQIVARGALSWAQARPILEDMVEELAAACADGTLPACLTTDQVWIPSVGRAQFLGTDTSEDTPEQAQSRALAFLGDIAALALEGQPRPAGSGATRIRALVPVHAEAILERLLGGARPYDDLGELQKDLAATHDRPARVTPLRRLGHLALMAFLLNLPFGGLIILLVLGYPRQHSDFELIASCLIWFCIGFWVGWALLFRGGFAFYRGGIALRTADGRKPSRLRCAWRALVVWLPIGLLLSLARLVAALDPNDDSLALGFWVAALVMLLGFALLAICCPTRSLHDRLAGTYLVPE